MLLRLTDGRSAALRAAVGPAPGLDAQVPSCPAVDLVLALRGRIPLDRLEPEGDPRLFDPLKEWEPEA
ncbi:hypothetical protein GCM10023235_10070 [Kitasatospora terrestris]|uniref:MDMPI C-terminal domain-containing protein n=1 Tax=Kitasatospora terrestris TaxID=258051 RepID=A0ABP9DDP0_9ACTN